MAVWRQNDLNDGGLGDEAQGHKVSALRHRTGSRPAEDTGWYDRGGLVVCSLVREYATNRGMAPDAPAILAAEDQALRALRAGRTVIDAAMVGLKALSTFTTPWDDNGVDD